jgi:hypothetical protein
MTADRLIRFYPRAWRERYGAEFVETVGTGALNAQQVVNIAMGAIDAWLSADVRRSTGPESMGTNPGGQVMLNTLKVACVGTKSQATVANGLVAAGVLLAATVGLLAAGIAVGRLGHPVLGDSIKSLAFPVSLTLSMPFSVMKGQPWRAQAVVIGGTFFILLTATYVATLI